MIRLLRFVLFFGFVGVLCRLWVSVVIGCRCIGLVIWFVLVFSVVKVGVGV